MKYDVIIAGVGGQGILSIATVIGRAALDLGLHLKQSEVHGMAQRGGAVQSHLRLSDAPIFSDLIRQGTADMILALEPLEALRYLPWLQPAAGCLVANEETFPNLPVYPAAETIYAALRRYPRHLLFDATQLARTHGAPRAVNMAMLGAASCFLTIPPEALERGIRAQFTRKGAEVVHGNLAVFRAGRELAEQTRGAW